MAIKIAFTKFGTVMGDFEEKMSGGAYTVTDPVMVSASPQSVGLFPFLAITTSKQITLKQDDLNFGEIFEPAVELRNHYSSQFGSGIVLK